MIAQGIYPALLTPFDQDGKINKPALRQLVDLNLEKGVNGFYVCGSTAEAFFLSKEERKEILETVTEHVNGRCTIIAHIGHIDTATAVDLARHAKENGADAMSSVAPFYYNFNFGEIKNYYFDIVNAVDLPMILYNIPAFSKVSLTVDNIAEFFDDPRFVALKNTSSDFFLLERLTNRYPDKIYFNGYDEMFLSGLAMGCHGAIGSTFNFMAEKFIAIQKLFKENRMQEALAEQHRANNIISALVKVGVMAGEKAMLCQMGIDFGTARSPFRPLTEDEIQYLSRVYAENT